MTSIILCSTHVCEWRTTAREVKKKQEKADLEKASQLASADCKSPVKPARPSASMRTIEAAPCKELKSQPLTSSVYAPLSEFSLPATTNPRPLADQRVFLF